MKKFTLAVLCILLTGSLYSQAFIAALDNDDYTALFGNDVIVTLNSGEELTGKLGSMTAISGYLSRVTLKDENKVKTKLKPADIQVMKIKAGKMLKMSMAMTSSVQQLVKQDFDEIREREYVIFETALRHNKKAKPRLMQLLNPGFDSVIKVYTDPNAKETGGIGVGGVKLTGGDDKSYMFVINEEQSVKVKKGKYKRTFEELYSQCPVMVETFSGDRIKWDDAAGHVYIYDQLCGKKK